MSVEPAWKKSLRKAIAIRTPLFRASRHNVFRLVHDLGDDLEGLFIDHYAGHLRLEAHDAKWETEWDAMHQMLQDELPHIQSMVAVSRDVRGKARSMRTLSGTPPSLVVGLENGCRFALRLNEADALGTGLFADMRLVRERVLREAGGKTVLNLFAHAGGFGAVAAVSGAKRVDHVDAARKCAPWAALNMALNGINPRQHRFMVDDAIKILKKAAKKTAQYDLILCDPPATAIAPDGKRWTTREHLDFYGSHLVTALKPGGSFMFSTNDRSLSVSQIKSEVSESVISTERTIKSIEALTLGIDYPEKKNALRLRPMRGVWVRLDD
ncbi:MAG: hypothetical protein CMH56_16130 [Myxococcales bacterium]|nr:hypothetical protein [Myxococcales bacterium]